MLTWQVHQCQTISGTTQEPSNPETFETAVLAFALPFHPSGAYSPGLYWIMIGQRWHERIVRADMLVSAPTKSMCEACSQVSKTPAVLCPMCRARAKGTVAVAA